MTLTHTLLLVIIYILLEQFHPNLVGPFAILVAAYLAPQILSWLSRQPAEWRKRRAERQQEARDEAEFWEREKAHREIRAKYDPSHEWNEATSLPREYLDEIRELNRQHEGMLRRRNGWTDIDFR